MAEDVGDDRERHVPSSGHLAATGNLFAVSRALGHASPTTTATADSDLDVIAEAAAR